METKIVLIRHGQSLANAQYLYLGHTDLDLTELGYSQAECAAEYFKNEKFGAIYSSDLIRAYHTAEPHARLHNLPINKSEKLREVFLGEWEGQPVDTLIEKWNEEFVHDWREKFGTTVPPKGEPVYEAGRRFYEELIRIARSTDGEILVVAHAAVIRAFWCYFQGVEPHLWAQFVPFPNNASASFLGFDGERFIPIRYSFDGYIDPESRSVVVEHSVK